MFENSIFNQIIKIIPRGEVKKVAEKQGSDRYRKSFSSWDHLVGMLYGQFSGSNSLRDLEIGFNTHNRYHYHLNTQEIRKSTLADANKTRNHQFFKSILEMLLKSQFYTKNNEVSQILTVLDSSLIRLSGRGYEWTASTKTRESSQGVKLHVQYTPCDDHIEYVEITAPNVNDVLVGRSFPVHSNRIYVFDRGYCDYAWWYEISKSNSTFVTRLKRNAAHRIVDRVPISKENQGFIKTDQIILLSGKAHLEGKKNHFCLEEIELRLISIPHPSKPNESLVLVSNDLTSSPEVIAGWYKQRWAIELFFKWIKQNLKIKHFYGENHNAVLVQIYSALIAYVLLHAFHKLFQASWRLKDTSTLLKTALFLRGSLTTPLRRSISPPLNHPTSPQLTWAF